MNTGYVPNVSKNWLMKSSGVLNVTYVSASIEFWMKIVCFVTVAGDGTTQNVSKFLQKHSRNFKRVMMNTVAPRVQKPDPTKTEYHGQKSMGLITSWPK